ncbi:sigma-70 family RNA polymerase sigma factor [Streptomyces sp. NBC_00887]|uniref:sigma-70 family RNA polymerase sigma factor n=1 Tax=Streptomyces sp. NBC_00887 TaxID=2975859 RepID=UPI0038674830|nr:sigma-70 family RNA polymerase sigma factor [Streptomyces sp. NBC_00887]
MQSADRGGEAGQQTEEPDLDQLMLWTAEGDREAFTGVYDRAAGPVMGLVHRVLRDPAQSEEVVQDVLLEVWRTSGRFKPDRGSAMTWIMTLAHRRAVDRVRAAQAGADRERKAALMNSGTPFDEVTERVETHLEWQQVRRCVRALTDIQRESVTLAYYGGLTCKEVAQSLSVPLGTVKTRLRDGLIRLRDCLGAKP